MAGFLGVALGWLVSHLAEAALVGAFGSAEAKEKYTECLADADCSDALMGFIPVSGVGKVTFVLVVLAFIGLGIWSRKRYLAKATAGAKK